MATEQNPGLLLVNLGSPDSPSVPDVRRYLDEFLMDGRVIDSPYLLRLLLVRGFILRKRPRQSAEAYQKIWTAEGSPLIVNSRRLEQQVAKLWNAPVALGMRYGNPSIAAGLEQLQQQGVESVIVVPLYPHYAMSSYETAVEKARTVAARSKGAPRLHFLAPFYDHKAYRRVLAENTRPHLEGEWDHLLFSFHGVPLRHITSSDPAGDHCMSCDDCCFDDHPSISTCYRAQVRRSARFLADDLSIPEHRWSVAYQSRLGNDPWLQPSTEATVVRLAQQGVRRLKVICPAFVADCLETIEEIDGRARNTFLEAGGEQFETVPCLNAEPAWARALVEMASDALPSQVDAT